MTELVGQPLDVVWLHSRRVIDHVVVSWSNSSLSNRLADKKEVKPGRKEQGTRYQCENNLYTPTLAETHSLKCLLKYQTKLNSVSQEEVKLQSHRCS